MLEEYFYELKNAALEAKIRKIGFGEAKHRIAQRIELKFSNKLEE